MSASIIRFPGRGPQGRDLGTAPGQQRVTDHDARLWMLASELFAMRLDELDAAGRRALCTELAHEPFIDAQVVLSVVSGDGGTR